jgi:hypothetical protein
MLEEHYNFNGGVVPADVDVSVRVLIPIGFLDHTLQNGGVLRFVEHSHQWSEVILGSLRSHITLGSLWTNITLESLWSYITLGSLWTNITLESLWSVATPRSLWTSIALEFLRTSIALEFLRAGRRFSRVVNQAV